MRSYSAQAYEQLIEQSHDEALQRYMKDEQAFVTATNNANERTFVDLGAGSGRAELYLNGVAGDVVAIEANPAMYEGLEARADELTTVRPVLGDFMQLSRILPGFIHHPAFLLLQNTLGTLENGDANQVLTIVRQEVINHQGSLILSVFRQPALRSWGLAMYSQIAAMVGNVDTTKTDLERGLFVTDTGYSAKWWTDAEINNMRGIGRVIRESLVDEYALIELDFSAGQNNTASLAAYNQN